MKKLKYLAKINVAIVVIQALEEAAKNQGVVIGYGAYGEPKLEKRCNDVVLLKLEGPTSEKQRKGLDFAMEAFAKKGIKLALAELEDGFYLFGASGTVKLLLAKERQEKRVAAQVEPSEEVEEVNAEEEAEPKPKQKRKTKKQEAKEAEAEETEETED